MECRMEFRSSWTLGQRITTQYTTVIGQVKEQVEGTDGQKQENQ